MDLSTTTTTAGWTFTWSTVGSAISSNPIPLFAMRFITIIVMARFTDVTERAGVPGVGYGMGVAVGDYDGDSFPDLLVTQYNGVVLYHNNGNGTFTDVTRKAGLPTTGWASSAVWFDYDNDGKLDLFICRFVDFDKSKNKFCGNQQTGALLLHSSRLRSHAELVVPQQRRWHLYRCKPGIRHCKIVG